MPMANNQSTSSLDELHRRYDGPIPAHERAAAVADDIAETRRVAVLTPRQQAEELIASQRDRLSGERRYILAILATRRNARAELQALHDRSGALYAGSDFLPLVRAKATMDAAERDGRFQLRWYFANRQLLGTFKAQLAAAIAAERIAA